MKTRLIQATLVSLLAALAAGSYCGKGGVPYSFEVLPTGAPVLGCAQPSCVLAPEDGKEDSAFLTDTNGQSDGFFRDGDRTQKRFRHESAPKLVVNCSGQFNELSCPRKNQWVGGIEYIDHPRQPLILQCCSFDGLKFSQEVGTTTVGPGEAITGGEVVRNGRQISFDVIANVRKVAHSGSQKVGYEVTVRRMNCLPDPPEPEVEFDKDVPEEVLKVLNTASNKDLGTAEKFEKKQEQKGKKGQKKQKPTQKAAPTEPLPEISADTNAQQPQQPAIQVTQHNTEAAIGPDTQPRQAAPAVQQGVETQNFEQTQLQQQLAQEAASFQQQAPQQQQQAAQQQQQQSFDQQQQAQQAQAAAQQAYQQQYAQYQQQQQQYAAQQQQQAQQQQYAAQQQQYAQSQQQQEQQGQHQQQPQQSGAACGDATATGTTQSTSCGGAQATTQSPLGAFTLPTLPPHSFPTLPPHSFPPHSFPTLPPHSFPTLPPHSLPTLPAHSLPPLGELPSIPTLPPHSLPAIPTLPPHSLPPLGELPSIPTLPPHSFPSIPTLPPHSLPPLGELPSIPTLPPHSFPTIPPGGFPTHTFPPLPAHSFPTHTFPPLPTIPGFAVTPAPSADCGGATATAASSCGGAAAGAGAGHLAPNYTLPAGLEHLASLGSMFGIAPPASGAAASSGGAARAFAAPSATVAPGAAPISLPTLPTLPTLPPSFFGSTPAPLPGFSPLPIFGAPAGASGASGAGASGFFQFPQPTATTQKGSPLEQRLPDLITPPPAQQIDQSLRNGALPDQVVPQAPVTPPTPAPAFGGFGGAGAGAGGLPGIPGFPAPPRPPPHAPAMGTILQNLRNSHPISVPGLGVIGYGNKK